MVFYMVMMKVAECYIVVIYKRVLYITLHRIHDDDCRKGDVMKRADIRKCFTEYVKAEDLQNGK